jgi:AbrB family looped-hinge helix DNA binding protein
MIVTLTSKRQVTFPKRVVEQLHLRAGDSLVLTETPDGVLMRPRRFEDAQMAPLKGKIRKTSNSLDLESVRHAAQDSTLRD